MTRLLVGICALQLVLPFAATAEAQDSTQAISAAEVQQLIKLDTVWLNFLRRRNARDYGIATPNGIQQDRFMTLGGIEQWVSIRGEDRNNPVLVLVHGGPGDATSRYGWAMLRPWFKRFTVVQWDQRGSGRTFGRNGASTPDVTIDRIVRDGIELSDSVARMFGKQKVVLVGHSFGSIVGLEMARARPDLFYAFVGTGQVGASSDSTLATAYRLVLATAKRRGERVAVRELTAIGPPPWRSGNAYAVEHKWTNLLEHNDAFLNATLAIELTAPGVSLRDVNDGFEGEGFSGDKLVPHLKDIDPALFRATFSVPIFVIQGAEDLTSPPDLARALVRAIHAPKSDYVTIAGGGHFALFTRSDAFLDELLTHVGFAR
ncbi:MAG TPA: alpha/beta hydrolase [Gemmatimonadaceae bacterium]|jgi:pimeloyl-ACP methyl ester carboxylesterase|nr:alpha/beta hydrolase [Gemmatimonadaceae bacterium]